MTGRGGLMHGDEAPARAAKRHPLTTVPADQIEKWG
jgi:hypothetical protein